MIPVLLELRVLPARLDPRDQSVLPAQRVRVVLMVPLVQAVLLGLLARLANEDLPDLLARRVIRVTLVP